MKKDFKEKWMAMNNIFYVHVQYLIFNSLLMYYNLSEVSPSVVCGTTVLTQQSVVSVVCCLDTTVKTEIKFSVFFSRYHCCDKEKSFSIKAKRQPFSTLIRFRGSLKKCFTKQ